jgi:hypothetical protein
MTTKELISKAILSANDQKPVDFKANVELVAAEKLKSKLATTIKTYEKNLFQKR